MLYFQHHSNFIKWSFTSMKSLTNSQTTKSINKLKNKFLDTNRLSSSLQLTNNPILIISRLKFNFTQYVVISRLKRCKRWKRVRRRRGKRVAYIILCANEKLQMKLPQDSSHLPQQQQKVFTSVQEWKSRPLEWIKKHLPKMRLIIPIEDKSWMQKAKQ